MKLTKKEKIKTLERAIEILHIQEYMCNALAQAMYELKITPYYVGSVNAFELFPELNKYIPSGWQLGDPFYYHNTIKGYKINLSRRFKVLNEILTQLKEGNGNG